MKNKDYYDDFDDEDSYDIDLDWFDYDCDLNDHKTKDKVKWIITAVAFVLIAVMLIITCLQVFGKGKIKPSEWFGKSEQPEAIDNNYTVQAVALSMSSARTVDGTVSKTVTANITPSSAVNKQLDWDISWAEGAELSNQEVTDYVTVTPTSDGSTTATVTCKQPFRGSNIIITATSRESGAVGYCMVAYNGEPSAIDVGDFYFSLSTSFSPLTLTNTFNDVGDEYYDQITVACKSVSGTVRVGQLSINGTEISFVNQRDIQATTAMVKPYYNKIKKRVEIDIQNSDNNNVISADGTSFSCVLEVSCNGITKTITGTFRAPVTKITMDSITF